MSGRIHLPPGIQDGREWFGLHPDGSISCPPDGGERLEYGFGLPGDGPVRRGFEDELLPVLSTEWERDGIRYTQTAFVTRLEPGELDAAVLPATDTLVLMVKLHGRNEAQEYRLAQATISLRAGGGPEPLVMRDGLLFGRPAAGERLRAAVEVQSSVHGIPDDGGVRFAGNMPPGTDGFLVVRIPARSIEGADAVERLRNLEYDVELRRVKTFWRGRAAGLGTAGAVPADRARPAGAATPTR